tara:strand:+ start:713 stop:958 length:246 start_codon:yes stop_codon:yes gene_type:complete
LQRFFLKKFSLIKVKVDHEEHQNNPLVYLVSFRHFVELWISFRITIFRCSRGSYTFNSQYFSRKNFNKKIKFFYYNMVPTA